MTAIANRLRTLMGGLCIGLFGLLVLIVVWQVFSRQVLNSPATWTTSVAQYTFVWVALFGSAWVFSTKDHIAVDFLTRSLKLDDSRATEVAVNVVIGLFAALVLLWGGIRGVGLTWGQKVSGLPVTVGMMYLALPVSGVLTVFFALHHCAEALRGRGLPSQAADEPKEAV